MWAMIPAPAGPPGRVLSPGGQFMVISGGLHVVRGQVPLSPRGRRIGEERPVSIAETEIVVIGMGPGGEDAATKLAEAGLHVTGVEARLVGGECPYWGCVPSKMMIRGANLLAEARRIPGMAGASTVTPDWTPVAIAARRDCQP